MPEHEGRLERPEQARRDFFLRGAPPYRGESNGILWTCAQSLRRGAWGRRRHPACVSLRWKFARPFFQKIRQLSSEGNHAQRKTRTETSPCSACPSGLFVIRVASCRATSPRHVCSHRLTHEIIGFVAHRNLSAARLQLIDT